MNETIQLKVCPRCDAPIPAEAPQGLCPRCVLAGASNPTEAGVAATATGEIPSIPRLAAAFPQLEILELIGRGGMGFVFKARQPHLDRHVALKLLPDKLAKDPHFAERFNREGRFLAKLNHPNIVSVFDFGQAGGFYYLMMEYVDGVNLRQAMRAGRFSPAEALAIVPKICEALQYAHEQGVLHRDIKPENILLDAKGRVKIADFGIAKLVGEDAPSFTLTGTGHALGTPHYMAPEQLETPGEVDHRADIYSLGVVFYEMLTGELPIGRFKPPSERTPLDQRVDEIVMRALERERELRQKNAGEFKTQVERVRSEPPRIASVPLPPGAKASTEANPASRFSIKAIWSAALVGLSLLLPLVSLSLILLQPRPQVDSTVPTFAYRIVTILALAFLPALIGTILGWVAVSDISASSGRLRGAALAVFGALAWPLLALSGFTVWLVIAPIRNLSAHAPFAGLLLLIVPAGMLTFIVWAIYVTARRTHDEPTTKHRGVLKWIFVALLLAGIGAVVSWFPSQRRDETTRQRSISATTSATNTAPILYVTVTSVELRDEGPKGRWLALDFSEQAQGGCELVVRTEGGGRKHTTRKNAFAKEIPGGTEVRHQRVEWLLPEDLDETARMNLRTTVAQRQLHQTLAIAPGDEVFLFEASLPKGGVLAAWFGATVRVSSTASFPPEKLAEYKATSARLDALRARETELLSRYTENNPLVVRVRDEIAEKERKKSALEKNLPAIQP
jgi:serine/threonine protein kinase